MKIIFYDGSIEVDHRILEGCPFFDSLFNHYEAGMPPLNEQEINFAEPSKNFSIHSFQEYLCFLTSENKNEFSFSDEWDENLINNPYLCLDIIYLAHYLPVDDAFIKHAIQPALKVLSQHNNLEQQQLINLERLLKSRADRLTFLDIFLQIKKRPFIINNQTETAHEVLQYIRRCFPERPTSINNANYHYFKTMDGRDLGMDLTTDETVFSLQKKFALHFFERHKIYFFPQLLKIIFCDRPLTNEDISSANIYRELPLFVVNEDTQPINERSLSRLNNANLSDINIHLKSANDIIDNIFRFDKNNYFSESSFVDFFNHTKNELSRLADFINENDFPTYSNNVNSAINALNYSLPYIKFFFKLFEQGVSLAEISILINDLEACHLVNSENIDEIEEKIISLGNILQSATSRLLLMPSQVEGDIIAKEMLYAKLTQYQNFITTFLRTKCAHYINALMLENLREEELFTPLPEILETNQILEDGASNTATPLLTQFRRKRTRIEAQVPENEPSAKQKDSPNSRFSNHCIIF